MPTTASSIFITSLSTYGLSIIGLCTASLFTACRTISNLLLPGQCLLCACALKGELICSSCKNDLPQLTRIKSCKQCKLALSTEDALCGHCLRQPPAFSQSYIPFAYTYPLDSLVLKFKYHRHLTSGKLLGTLLADHIQQCSQEPSWQMPHLLIPAPMHWTRRWQRGFNQAEILTAYIASKLQLPYSLHLIKRQQRTPSQKELSRLERQKNLRKAFSISDKNASIIAGKRIALIDDVVTTTATVRELSKLLRKAGAADVQVWALARTMDRQV
ncbi:MAG: ComF family protein [Moraxellaceae bacterium]|nr:MAG: ComF family protein [Moraxellaceae bacterium]